jgi:hypothetical protein
MGWAEERARLLSGDPSEAITVPFPLPVRWGRQKGDIAVQSPDGEWHELAYTDATPVWKTALRKHADE